MIKYSDKTQLTQRPTRNAGRPDRKIRAKLRGSGLFTRATGVTIANAAAVDRTGRDPIERQAIRNFIREKAMRSKLMLILTAGVAVMLSHPLTQTVWAQGQAALTGTVSSDAEGKMEGVVITATKPGSIVEISVTTDAQGRYTFPESRLDPGEYAISIRAVGYDIDSPAKATVAPEATA